MTDGEVRYNNWKSGLYASDTNITEMYNKNIKAAVGLYLQCPCCCKIFVKEHEKQFACLTYGLLCEEAFFELMNTDPVQSALFYKTELSEDDPLYVSHVKTRQKEMEMEARDALWEEVDELYDLLVDVYDSDNVELALKALQAAAAVIKGT